MSSDTAFTIGELAQAAGVTTRTIRYYVAQGLLPPPHGGGRVASYGEGHLHRLELIKLLKQEYLPLNEIKALLACLDDDAVTGLLKEKRQPPPTPAPGAAKEYLQALLNPPAESSPLLRQIAADKAVRPSEPSPSARTPAAPSRSGRLARRSPVSAENARPDEATSSAQEAATEWQRYSLHPDVEVHVRQPPTDPTLSARLDNLLADIRRLFSKRYS